MNNCIIEKLNVTRTGTKKATGSACSSDGVPNGAVSQTDIERSAETV